MGRLREEIFVRIRPDLHIHGSRREGFTFTRRDGRGLLDFSYLFEAAKSHDCWRARDADEHGLRVLGRELNIAEFSSQAYATFADFCADAVRHYHDWMPRDGHRRPRLQQRHPRSHAAGWPQILAPCLRDDHRRAFRDCSLKEVIADVELINDGLYRVHLVRVSTGYRLVHFVGE